MADGGLWADPQRARAVVEEAKGLKRWLEPYHALRKRVGEGRELAELVEAEAHVDLEMQRGLEAEAATIAAHLDALSLQRLLHGPDAGRRALLTVYTAAGGT